MENKQQDSTIGTLLHIKRVSQLLGWGANELISRGVLHDASKLESFEKEGFDKVADKLKDSTYGSDEYQEFLTELAPILAHHYKLNSHHPEHYEDGIDGMNLFDIIEMFYDWKASSERHTTGNIYNSIHINSKRFGMSDQLANIFKNTARYLRYKK